MKVLGLTMARGGSKGIPHKNIKEIAGKPLIAWTIEEATKSKHLNNYIVSTDDDKIIRFCNDMGVQAIQRPERLARDDTPIVEALEHALSVAESQYGIFDIVADIRCTNPLKDAGDIDGAIELLIAQGADSVIGVSPVTPPERIKRLVGGRIVDTFPEPPDGNRQFLPEYWVRNGSIYVTWVEWIRKGKLWGHGHSLPWIMQKPKHINLDDWWDWKLAEVLLSDENR